MNDIKTQLWKDVYASISGLWLSPQDVALEKAKKDAEEVAIRLEIIDKDSAMALSRFLREDTISEEDYIELFELEPKCSLYLGSHSFDEPKTCANAAVSGRNGYMIELLGIYRHFGQTPDRKEMPDYLPLMVEFLSLTSQSRDDTVREKLIKEYILPFLAPMRSRLEELKTPYLYLLEALEKILNLELKTRPLKIQEANYVG